MDLAEQRQASIAYLALCELRGLVEDLGDEPEELSAARRHLHGLLKPEEAAPASDTRDGRPEADQPFDNFDAAPRDLQDRIIMEAVGGHRRTTMEISDTLKRESPDIRTCGQATRKVVARLFAAGEFDREPCRSGPCRYRYFRRVPDIAELEQAFEAAA